MSKKKGRTLPSLIHEFLRFKAIAGSDTTIRHYKTTLEVYAYFCFNKRLDPLECDTIHSWIAELKKPFNGKRRRGGTINQYISRLNSFFDYIIKREYMAEGKRPTRMVERLPLEGRFVRGFDHNEASILVKAAAAHKYSNYWVPMILLAWHYGMRLQDCAYFSKECVNWDAMSFSFTPRKQKRREIRLPLHEDVATALRGVESEDPDHYFPMAIDKYNKNSMSAEFKTIVRKAKLDNGLSFHCLRHGAATNMIKMGIRLTTIVEIIGWTSTAMLQRYLDTDVLEVEKVLGAGSLMEQ